MHRRHLVLLVAVLVPVLGACTGDHEAEPTIPSVDFTPRLVVLATPGGLDVEAGERDEGISVDPPGIPVGSVLEVRNADSEDHRITAGTTIDTGVLRPGDSTTLVMTTEGDVEVRDTTSGEVLTITVRARTDER